MKNIFLLFCFLFLGIQVIAQKPFYGYIPVPYCWDSLGTPVQTYKLSLHTSNKLEGTKYALFNEDSEVIIGYNESDLSPGYCGEINRVGRDTVESVTCLILTRQMVNSVNSAIIYPESELEKRTYSVGSQIVEIKYYEPHSGQLVESPAIAVSTRGCNDYSDQDFAEMIFQGDTLVISEGVTDTIDFGGTPFSVFSITCNSLQTLALDFVYDDIIISGNATTVAGNHKVYLRSYATAYTQKWEYQKISRVVVTAIKGGCDCTYTLSQEFKKF